MTKYFEQTIKQEISCDGIGLHSGAPIHMNMKPAPVGTGIIFIRTDIQDKDNHIPAKYDYVVDTRMCSCVGNKSGIAVGTIEHLMAALGGLQITNLYLEVNGPEVPVMDGSSGDFVALIEKAGIEIQNAPLKAIKILKEISFQDEKGASVCLKPEDSGLTMDFEIDFPQSKAIGHQTFSFLLTPSSFKESVSFARTFGFAKEVEMLRSMGLGRGGTLENAVIVDGDTILTPGGTRAKNEFVLHKILDAIGDLYQLGLPIIGRFSGVKSGHMHTNTLLRQLMANPSTYQIVEVG